MMSRILSPSNLAPLLTAKGHVPLLPCPHVPRPRLVAALVAAVRSHRLVLLSAGPLTGKTTLLAELVGTELSGHAFWYSVDEMDDSPHVLLEGLARAVGSDAVSDGETHALGQIIGVLDAGEKTTVLILDDIHRSPAAVSVVERVLRYLPPRAHLLLGGHPEDGPPSALYRWLEDRGQVARFTGADLRLDDEERAHFHACTRLDGGAWAVDYRRGGQRAVVDELRAGVLPMLDAGLRSLIDLLCVLPMATVAVLGAALPLAETEMARRVTRLRDETILIEQLDPTHYRLSETARQAALMSLPETTLDALRRDAAVALDGRDPAMAAYLFAQVGDAGRAAAAARRVSWWEWQRRQSLGMAVANLLPPSVLCCSGALALIAARLRLVERGVKAIHALVRAIRPDTGIDRIERLRLLALCCAGREHAWGLGRCIDQLDALVVTRDPHLTALERSYAFVVLGTARSLAGDDRAAADALRLGLDLLTLAEGDEPQIAYVRLLARRALAVVHRRLGHLVEAEDLYADAHKQAMDDGLPYVQAELANNRAVLLQQRGEHARSADILRAELASPWAAERGLPALLNASLADALDALGDRAAAARALRIALADMQERDVYGLQGHVRATLALLLAEGGHADAAFAEIAAGAPRSIL
jgi:tetratricopeptide (TPR) repeat protein